MTAQPAPERVLVVVAHPDDAEIGCGGTVARWTREGKEVFYLVCTKGGRGTDDPKMTEKRLETLRQKEQRAAASILGVSEVTFLDNPDGELQNTLAFREQVVKGIRKHRPDVVVTHDPALFHGEFFVNHPDHRATSVVTIDAVYPSARDRLAFPEHLALGLEPHRVREIHMFFSNEPNFWVDIEATMDLKAEALRQHHSQFGGFEDLEAFIRNMALEAGRNGDAVFAEGFRRIVMAF